MFSSQGVWFVWFWGPTSLWPKNIESGPTAVGLGTVAMRLTVYELYDTAERMREGGRLEEAIAKLQEALAADSTFALAHSALAVLYEKVGKHSEAISHADEVCRLEPHDPFSFTALSVTYRRAFAGTGRPEYIGLAEEAMARAQALQGG